VTTGRDQARSPLRLDQGLYGSRQGAVNPGYYPRRYAPRN
jgi:hypothetical protein